MGSALPEKGGRGLFGIEKCLEFVEECGDRGSDILIKSDQEPAIRGMIQGVVEEKG
jgi:hypothetical protein